VTFFSWCFGEEAYEGEVEGTQDGSALHREKGQWSLPQIFQHHNNTSI